MNPYASPNDTKRDPQTERSGGDDTGRLNDTLLMIVFVIGFVLAISAVTGVVTAVQ